METVEKAGSAIPESAVEEQGVSPEAEGESPAAETTQHGPSAAPAGEIRPAPLAGLLQTGLRLLEELAVASRSASANGSENRPLPAGLVASFIGRDEQTGQSYLKLPMPKPEVLDQALQAIGALLEGWGRQGG